MLEPKASAEWVSMPKADSRAPGQPAAIRVLRSNLDETVVRVDVSGVDLRRQEGLTTVDIPGAKVLGERGYPALPVIDAALMIPFGSTPSLRVTRVETAWVSTGVVRPSLGPVYRCQGPTPPLVFDRAYRRRNSVFPRSPAWARVRETFEARDTRGLAVTIYPVRYSFAEESVEVLTALEFVVETPPMKPGTSRYFVPESEGQAVPSESFGDFSSFYRHHLINYPLVVDRGRHSIDRVRAFEAPPVLVVTPERFVSGLAPWIAWKQQTGFPVTVRTLEGIGSSYRALKDHIRGAYEQDRIGFVLLVGDADLVPFHPGTIGNATGNEADPLYAAVAGDDRYPDLVVGRFSVSNESELGLLVQRTLQYEQQPELGATWYQTATGVASNDSSGGPTDRARAEILRQTLLESGYQSVDQIYDPNASQRALISAVEEGRGLINYIGHGSKTSWVTTGLANSHVSALENGPRMPVIISVACVNGDFGSGSDCFAERWTKTAIEGTTHGAIAVFASSTNQAWDPPVYGQKVMVESLIAGSLETVGAVFTHGSVEVLKEGSVEAIQTFETWHTFGDPTLRYRTRTPETMDPTLPDVVLAGTQEIQLGSIDPGAWIGIVQDGKILGRAIVGGASGDPQTEVSIPLAGPLVQGVVRVTITGRNKVPLQKDISVAAAL